MVLHWLLTRKFISVECIEGNINSEISIPDGGLCNITVMARGLHGRRAVAHEVRLPAAFAAKQEHRHARFRIEDFNETAGSIGQIDPLLRNLLIREVGCLVEVERVLL
ncbi:MAG: hypothetical protein BGP12_09480 [Rhodospirillales bacterium 70-18]|nr:MAG: hypothetical protein BGP12_09480 [Rhodospirillales bacterium 70-18]